MKTSEIFTIGKAGVFDKISLKERNSYNKTVSFDRDLIDSLEKEPGELTTWTIIKQIQYFSDNKLRSGIFEVELYKRLVRPFTLIAMILTAMIFIFGSTRDVTLGRKIFLGVALGLAFELLSRIGGALALSFDFSPLFSSFLPAFIVIIISIFVLIKKSKQKFKIPNQFYVVLLNDDYTSMEFVVEVLRKFFNKEFLAAEAIMLKIHIDGEAVCGIYSYDVAQTKVSQVIEYSRTNDQPLMSVLREVNL